MTKSHLYQQAGNSVTVPLIERIFGEIKKNFQNRKFIKCTCNVITT
ncbi:MAG: DNA cytosine methyltransferase [Neisseriaceae bacterium]|nr:DNA cytosine methyltransferase [Neisseriaceae bacterium]